MDFGVYAYSILCVVRPEKKSIFVAIFSLLFSLSEPLSYRFLHIMPHGTIEYDFTISQSMLALESSTPREGDALGKVSKQAAKQELQRVLRDVARQRLGPRVKVFALKKKKARRRSVGGTVLGEEASLRHRIQQIEEAKLGMT